MGHTEPAQWTSTVASGLRKRDRASGRYEAYVPDPLLGGTLAIPAALETLLAEAERAARSVGANNDLVGIARFLLRSEAIASSRIEGIAPSPRQVALAELADHEGLTKVSELAHLVAHNMTVVQRSRTTLAEAPAVTVDGIVGLHAALLPDQPQLHGLRTVQNWIGGSDYHPIGADFVPPPPAYVAGLLDDLASYLNAGSHAPVVQAALVHAQFETIHPFVDGNGRVGRALIHTVLTRRGVTPDAVLPVSLVLATLRHEYVAGLNAYRHLGASDSLTAHEARARWIETFAQAVIESSAQARALASDLAELREGWDEALFAAREASGRERGLRRDATAAQILDALAGTPVLTAATVERVWGVSRVSANKALDELATAGILGRTTRGNRHVYHCPDVLDLITSTERRLASTRFDTRVSPPVRAVPARPSEHSKPSRKDSE